MVARQRGQDVVINLGGDAVPELDRTTLHSLEAADFLLA